MEFKTTQIVKVFMAHYSSTVKSPNDKSSEYSEILE